MRLTPAQMKKMVSKIQAGLRKTAKRMKGSGPLDYSAPKVLQAYMRKHPMSKLEFYVDHSGTVMGSGNGKKSKISFMALVRKVASFMADEVKKELKASGRRVVKKTIAAGEKQVENAAKDAVRQAVQGITGKAMKGGHFIRRDGTISQAEDRKYKGHDHNVRNPSKVRIIPRDERGSRARSADS